MQVFYSKLRTSLPAKHVDVYSNPAAFVSLMLAWASRRSKEALRACVPAVTVIRGECHVFAGVGVYSVCEIFYWAGKEAQMVVNSDTMTIHRYRYITIHNGGRICYVTVAYGTIHRSVHIFLSTGAFGQGDVGV